jgi:hypothetical protein
MGEGVIFQLSTSEGKRHSCKRQKGPKKNLAILLPKKKVGN